MLTLIPTAGRKIMAPTKDMVMPIITQKAKRYSKNKPRITSTIIIAMSPFSVSKESLSRKSSALLLSIRTCTPGGKLGLNSSSISFTVASISRGD